MKRVLLDHCVPRRVREALVGCEVATAYQRGWNELKNGALLEAAERDGFELLVTADKNLRYQQQLAHRRIAIIDPPTRSLLCSRTSVPSLRPWPSSTRRLPGAFVPALNERGLPARACSQPPPPCRHAPKSYHRRCTVINPRTMARFSAPKIAP